MLFNTDLAELFISHCQKVKIKVLAEGLFIFSYRPNFRFSSKETTI